MSSSSDEEFDNSADDVDVRHTSKVFIKDRGQFSSDSPDSSEGESESEKRRLDKLAKGHMSERSEIEIQSNKLARHAENASELMPLLNSDGESETKCVRRSFGQELPLELASAPYNEQGYTHLMRYTEFTLHPHNFRLLSDVENAVELFLAFYSQRSLFRPLRNVLRDNVWKQIDKSLVRLLDGLSCISNRKILVKIAGTIIAEIDFDEADTHIRECLVKMVTKEGYSSKPTFQTSSKERSYLVSTPNIPTSSETTGKNLAVINQYFRDCKTKGCDTRFNAWPETLTHNIQWIWQGRDFQKPEFASAPVAWQEVDLDILIKWLDGLIHSPTIINGVQAFKDLVNNHPIVFDTDSDINAICGTFALNMQQYSLLWSRIEQDQTLSQSISDADQKGFVSDIQQKLRVVGKSINQNEATKTMRRRILEQIRTTVHKDHLPEQYEQQTVRDKVKRSQALVKPYLLGVQQAFQAYLSLKSNLTVEWTGMFNLAGKYNDDHLQSKRDASSEAKSTSKKRDASIKNDSSTSQETCNGCGLFLKLKNGGPPKCPRNSFNGCGSDERRNKDTSSKWSSSKTGKEWKQKFNLDFLPHNSSVTLSNAKRRDEKPSNPTKSKDLFINATSCVNSLTNDENILYFSLYDLQELKSRKFRANTSESIGLLDSGAIGCSIISPSFKSFIEMNNYITNIIDVTYELHAPLTNNKTVIANQKFIFDIFVQSERQHSQLVKISVQAIVAPIDFDLILDRETIKANDLIAHFPSHFTQGKLLQKLLDIDLPTNDKKRKLENRYSIISAETRYHKQLAAIASKNRTLFQKTERVKMKQELSKLRNSRRHYNKHKSRDKLAYLATLIGEEREQMFLSNLMSNRSKKSAFEREGGLPELPDNKLESIPSELLLEPSTEDQYKLVKISGTPELQARLKDLVAEFRTIFSSTLSSVPAKISPFQLEIDLDKWEVNANRTKARHSDSEKQEAMIEMINKLQENGIIEPCNDSYYSHGFLVPKPNRAWRLVVDFKNLNAATIKHYNWPIPNIKEMLYSIGSKKPKLFAVFDLTSGYYQIEITEDSRGFTAFMTHNGVYRWLRLPMGLTGAGSHFQNCLTTEVLADFIHNFMELYLDDGIVFAETDDEFIERLRAVFASLRDHNLTLNPLKCVLGLTQVEYVGHTINCDGLHFTRDKLDSVMNFPTPKTKKQVKAFLGLANYFRDHIRNHSNIVVPLQEIVNGYTKKQARRSIKWTSKCEDSFVKIKKSIDECPLLWFIDDVSPIFLQTDASEYGIGAYLYQVVTDSHGIAKEHPIGFISKSIYNIHLNWDVPMKEGFAIFYALRKWEHLLRDRQFTILTDHENLTRLRVERDTNKMVKRWFMAYQEFDIIEWRHVKGEDNGVADTFSRLCPQESPEPTAKLLYQLTGYEIPTDKWDLITTAHNAVVGHGGVDRTLVKLDTLNLHWDDRTTHVRRFIKMCSCCQKMDQLKKVIHAYPYTISTYGLWHTVSIDYIESLVPDVYGMTMIVVIIDNFSRFVDLYATNSTEAEGAADALIAFSGRYGTPMNIQTDRGPSFRNDLIASLTKRLGINHEWTAPYSKEENGIVERVNKETLRHLRNIIFDKRVGTKWSKYLPLVQRVINTSKHSATGLTPAQIVFPNGIQLDKGILTGKVDALLSAYMNDLLESQQFIIAIAEKNLREKDKKHIENYSKDRTVFEVGSYVLAEHRHDSLRRGPKSKLLPFL